MTKLSRKPLDPAKFGHYINNLWSVFTVIGSKEDIRLLFKDLFTSTEYKMFAKRLEVARRLLEEDTYESIQRDLNVTSVTINKISNILKEKGDGLRKAHQELLALEDKYMARQRERTKNLENPFRIKLKRKTVGGELIKAGLKGIDRVVSKKLRQKSASKKLSV